MFFCTRKRSQQYSIIIVCTIWTIVLLNGAAVIFGRPRILIRLKQLKTHPSQMQPSLSQPAPAWYNLPRVPRKPTTQDYASAIERLKDLFMISSSEEEENVPSTTSIKIIKKQKQYKSRNDRNRKLTRRQRHRKNTENIDADADDASDYDDGGIIIKIKKTKDKTGRDSFKETTPSSNVSGVLDSASYGELSQIYDKLSYEYKYGPTLGAVFNFTWRIAKKLYCTVKICPT